MQRAAKPPCPSEAKCLAAPFLFRAAPTLVSPKRRGGFRGRLKRRRGLGRRALAARRDAVRRLRVLLGPALRGHQAHQGVRGPVSVAATRALARTVQLSPVCICLSVAPRNGNANSQAERAQNIMFDKRVHRGSAYVMREETPESPGRDGSGESRKPSKGATRAARYQQHQQQQQQHQQPQQQQRPATPPPVGGRFHMDVQTDNYLEELTDRNPEVDADTQTDALLDLHPPISFVPTPSGVDVATQIEGGDLFDFDLEVEPILEVLVGKTLELGMLELLEEMELREIRQRQELFEQARNAELAEVQRLEAEAKRRFAEKQRRLDEETARLAAQAELEEKVAARASAKQYLASLHAQVFDTLVESGHFFDPLANDVKQNFLPRLLESAAARAQQLDISRKVLDAMLVDALRSQAASG
ncbi:hypothetical protein ON010_g277 [Phytophthora cinnamomi]|nr:hypothetical protein ON010_g277 [Phytophthora cinnamomi]